MPDISGLRDGDPTEVAGHRVTGRLGSGVYAGRAPTGEAVLIRLLPAELDPTPFLHAMEPLRGVAAVSTAQVLSTGVLDDRAYVVSEFVDGPTLQEAGGGLDGVALHRLAAGTITALVAIHQEGFVHGDISPANVRLGPDGPRVINLGLERALAEAATATREVGVPAYTAPERLRGAEGGPPADVFSWAATMVFAVTGASPFEGGSMAATVDRITGGEPDLPDLGELHGLIVACLAKDPAARPAASEVLLRLVGQTSFLTGPLRAGPSLPGEQPAPPPIGARPRVRVLALVAAFAAGALVSGIGVYALVDTGTPVRGVAATSSPGGPAAQPTVSASATVAPLEKVEKKAATDTELPTIGATLHEHPSDPVRAASYLEAKGKFTAYVRERGGAFKAVGTAEEPALAPGGDWVALNPFLKFQNSEMDHVKLTRLSTGESFVVTTVKKPLQTMTPVWSRDGARLLMSVIDAGEPRRVVGFVVVDLATRKAVHVETEYFDDAAFSFTFTPDGSIARGYGDGKRHGIEYFDMSGQVTKTLHWVGAPRDRDWFSPSGKSFVTFCPSEKEICVWNSATGARQATVPVKAEESSLLGWFTDKHLLIQEPGKKGAATVKVVDLLGTTQRVLADVEPGRGLLRFARFPGR
ncbi:protein kinase domain-containing protein [Nonomuraea sp. KM88]|uniref:protein kinase domain-containing protein n=1 Tax=Nonomuraea sp. KM88 TaxID=3457427 RepID=UPI003FCD2A03